MQYGEPWSIKRERYRLMGDNEWRRWFAWYPVTLRDDDFRKVWWEEVEYNQPMSYDLPRYRVPRVIREAKERV